MGMHILQKDVICAHGLMRTLGKWWRTDFPDANQINKCPKTVSCKECTNVQKDINENDEKIDTQADSEQTFFSSYFMKELNHTVESIELRFNEINMERIQDKGEKMASQKQDDKNVTVM